MNAVISEFDVKGDERKRFTIREAAYEHYHVSVYEDGRIILEPRILADATISRRTLGMIDSAMENLDRKPVGSPLDIAALEAMADSDE